MGIRRVRSTNGLDDVSTWVWRVMMSTPGGPFRIGMACQGDMVSKFAVRG